MDMNIQDLKPHPLNDRLYGGEEIPQGFIDSVRSKGILVPLAVKQDGTIISGHRRWRTAQVLNMDTVPTTIVGYNTDLDEREAIISFNKQREKTFSQTMAEAEELEVIEGERAAVRMLAGKAEPSGNVSLGSQGQTRDKVAEQVGIGSGRTYDKAKQVWEAAKQGNENAQAVVQQLDNKQATISAAYSQIKSQQQKAERLQQVEQERQAIESGELTTAQGLYDVIVIDPPWDYAERGGFSVSEHDAEANRGGVDYATMKVAEVQAIDLPARDDSVLFLWTTHKFLRDAFTLLDAWGYTYKATIVWDKEKMGIGRTIRLQCEFCLLAVKGQPILDGSSERDIIREARREHSRKPEAFYEFVERFTVGRKLDYFSRHRREGWDHYGADTGKFQ